MSDADRELSPPNGTPRDTIERAKVALHLLKGSQTSEKRIATAARVTVIAVVFLACGGLVIHTFFEDGAPKVDSTSVALLAVALIAPFVSRLKALELGGAKAEWREGAEGSLKEIVHLVEMQQAALELLFNEIANAADSAELAATPDGLAASNARPVVRCRPLKRIVWVDDHPENNTYEVESLVGIVDVITVKTNQEAFSILANNEIDAVISDIGRDYDRAGAPGGVQLIQELRRLYPDTPIPVLYYTSVRSIQRYGRELEALGAVAMTSLFSDLLRALRQIDQQNLEAIAASTASRVGLVLRDNEDPALDVVVELATGEVVGIEVGSWLQRPQMSAFVDRASRLVDALSSGRITRGLLLVRPEVLDDRGTQWAAEHSIELVSPDDLEQTILRGAQSFAS